jgi:cyclase
LYWAIIVKIACNPLKAFLWSVLWLLLFSATHSFCSVQKLGPDLYAYISENDASSHSTFLVSDKGILVVDTGLNGEEGRKLLAEIRKFSPAPVRWIVNTHYHQDHRGGNDVVGPDATIITTAYTRKRVKATAPQQYSLNAVEDKELTLYVGTHPVHIYHPGPAHTLGDMVVFFPDQQTIATGDLFLTNSCPAMDEGDMENWIRALNAMLSLPLAHVVPGHFELATAKELRRFHDYLVALRGQVKPMYRDGLSFEQVKRRISLPAFKGFRQFAKYEATFVDNAASYYTQLQRRAKKP